MEDVGVAGGMKTQLSSSSTRNRGLAGPGNPAVYEASTETFSTVPIPGVGTFYMEGKQFKVPEGTRVTWKTVELKK
jgi:hypothetical protein